jgi:RNA polymerase sigma-70 factor (ECF subfamily)
MDQHQESEIVRGLREGQTVAWQRLYDAHAERIWRLVARAMEPASADVGDVVQETFLAAAKSAHQVDFSRGTLWSWLRGIARRQVALYYRRRRSFRRQAGQPAGGSIGDSAEPPGSWRPDPLDATVRAELVRCIRSILTQLPTDYELLLVAKYMDGASVEEIAVSEMASLEATRSKLARARRAFRRLFERSRWGAAGRGHGKMSGGNRPCDSMAPQRPETEGCPRHGGQGNAHHGS